MASLLINPEQYSGKSFINVKGNAECVEFLIQALGAPPTALWSEGQKVKKDGAPLPPGTPIATFVNGTYPQHGSTGKHAAIYLGRNSAGIQVLDQWAKQGKVLPRTIRWLPTSAGLSNDGNAFSVVEW